MDLNAWSACLRLLSDPTRVRLLALLDRDELTVAELAQITGLAQPRVSTHLARLKEAGLAVDRRAGVSAYYRFAEDPLNEAQQALWKSLSGTANDPLLQQDALRLPEVLAQRAASENWADNVAGDMERHYSPGRTWEAMARAALQLVDPGRVLDIASGDGLMAELFKRLRSAGYDTVTTGFYRRGYFYRLGFLVEGRHAAVLVAVDDGLWLRQFDVARGDVLGGQHHPDRHRRKRRTATYRPVRARAVCPFPPSPAG